MKALCLTAFLCLSLGPISPLLHADEPLRLIGNDGREVLLHADGTWEYASRDILLDTPSGSRVRLKPDNSWEYEGQAPLRKEQQHRETHVDIQLAEVFISENVSSAGASKNTRRETALHFVLQIRLAARAEQPLDLSRLQAAQFAVSDNRGNAYEIERIETQKTQLSAGQLAEIRVITAEAPSLLSRPNELFLDIAPEALGTEPVRLSEIYGRIERRR